MKKEYFWFFIFILAAAVVAGSTLGIITNFKYLSQQSKIQQHETSNTSINQNSANPSTKESVSSNTAQQIASNGKMAVSPEEQQEINNMLDSMEINNTQDSTARIKDFQEKNSLPVTGKMDTDTLNVLINQVTLEKAIERLNNN